MPELPEVQTIVSDLNKKIVGDTITDFWSDWGKTIKGISVKKFKDEIKGKKILKVRRIGKNIFIDLSGKKTIYIHLKMTGHLLIKDNKNKSKYFEERVNQYIHHIFHLSKSKTMEFSDLRKFGKIVLVKTGEIMELKEIKALGPDIIDGNFSFKIFNEILENRKNRKIRDILMDQGLMAGIGNIYLSEILFRAGILPTRVVKSIDQIKRKKLHSSILKILKKAIKMRGTSDSDYRDASGAPGKFQEVLKVYRREGQKCEKCGTIIKRIKMGQRSTFYCLKCQK